MPGLAIHAQPSLRGLDFSVKNDWTRLRREAAPHTTVPKSAPTPAVSAMASAPQNVTRTAPLATPAPPTRAATPPRSARNTSDAPDTTGIRPDAGVTAVTARGRAAPTAKLAGRRQRRLDRARARRLGDAELVAGMRAERIVGHELVGNLLRERRIEAAPDVDRRQLLALALVVRLELGALARELGLLGIRL